tara:strand:+ start:237 stop:1622 length:1386 start_codon:yes stop_codon:yes gene_type:complete
MIEKIFGTDGIRAIAGEGVLSPEKVRLIGYSFARSMFGNNAGRVFISNDGRLSCKDIEEDLIRGISQQGSSCIIVGLLPTPALSICINKLDESMISAIQITASHNQYKDNGMKFFDNKGEKISRETQKKMEEIITHNQIEFTNNSLKEDSCDNFKDSYRLFIQEYINRKISSNPKIKPVNVVVDCANGAFSEIIETLFSDHIVNIIPVNNVPNGRNINFKCGATDTKYIQNLIESNNKEEALNKNYDDKLIHYDFGLAIDGDGDRAIFIDHLGNVLDGDDILLILSKYGNPTPVEVIGTLMTNFGIRESYKKLKINFVETDVGDINVLNAMKINSAAYGGESSGHIIINDFNGFLFGDAIVTFINVLCLLNVHEKSLYELSSIIDKTPSELLNIKTTDKLKFLSDDTNKSAISKIKNEIGKNGRILVRPSGTENAIRILIEHTNHEKINLLKNYLYDNIKL